MINFFRKIKQKLLSENKFSKYLLYAIGEIVLVVIGILIALQINNWNQHQSDKAKFRALLYELATNLTKEVTESEFVLETYYEKDSLIALSLAEKLEEKDIQAICPECPRVLLLNYKKIPINTIAYEHIKSIIDRIPTEYEYLITEIKELYEIDAQLVLDQQNSIQNKSSDFRKSLISSYEWFRQIPYSRLNSDAIDYFLNNPIYKNHLMDFSNRGKNYWTYLNQFRARAIYVLYLISQIEEVQLKELLDDKAYLTISKDDPGIAGRYRVPDLGNHEFTIHSEGIRNYTDMFPEGNIELVPQSDSLFYCSSRFIKFKFANKPEKSLSLIGSDGTILICKKIE